MSYVIAREDGKYVTNPGVSIHSYTKLLQEAWWFATREQAEKQVCSNERIIDVNQLLGRNA